MKKKNKIINVIKIISVVILSLMFFVLIQSEYEMITRPELVNDYPWIASYHAVYILGFILVIIVLTGLYLIYSIIKSKEN